MQWSHYISFICGSFILWFFYLRVIKPFIKKMLAKEKKDEFILDDSQIFFDDDELFDKKDDKLAMKIKKIKQQTKMQNDHSEDEMRYNILLQKLKEIVENETTQASELLSTLSAEDMNKG